MKKNDKVKIFLARAESRYHGLSLHVRVELFRSAQEMRYAKGERHDWQWVRDGVRSAAQSVVIFILFDVFDVSDKSQRVAQAHMYVGRPLNSAAWIRPFH